MLVPAFASPIVLAWLLDLQFDSSRTLKGGNGGRRWGDERRDAIMGIIGNACVCKR